MRKGLSLVEVIVSLGLAGLMLVIMAVLYKSAGRDFESGTSTVMLTQSARLTMEKITPYLTSAVPPATGQVFIYSPVAKDCSQDPDVHPNIYSLDFLSCVDFLNAEIDTAGRYVGYTNRRGTAPRNRYRIAYDPAKGELWLEKLSLTSVTPTVVAGNSRRKLAGNLHRVTFERVQQGVNVRISARTTSLKGFSGKDGKTLDPDDPNVPRHLQAREYELFTTVLIPYYTSR